MEFRKKIWGIGMYFLVLLLRVRGGVFSLFKDFNWMVYRKFRNVYYGIFGLLINFLGSLKFV